MTNQIYGDEFNQTMILTGRCSETTVEEQRLTIKDVEAVLAS